jgi:1-deoxy-D-xylulose-5-phosphate synthase
MNEIIKVKKYKYLNDINSPFDLRKLPEEALPVVCNEVRDFMIETITKVGGHFGAGLGVVELTVALHYILNTPTDKIIFDTGHQGYPHKILTGRRDRLHTIRQKGGLSGFLKIKESEYDAFGAGHASTSISAALGMAAARDFKGDDHEVVAVIGDGALTGGMAFEALNNCGVQKRNITVIVNDNDASISPNVSAFQNYFNDLYTSSLTRKIKDGIWDLSGKMDEIGDRIRGLASRVEKGVKSIITPGMMFESFGFKYFGPINGHNVQKLARMIRLSKEIKEPVLLHVFTQKGKGFAAAEEDKLHLHAIGKAVSKVEKKDEKPKTDSYSQIFGKAMLELCKKDDKIVAITAAMSDGTGLNELEKELPNAVIDVGIAEQHAVTFAAGLAREGIMPVCAIYSTFLQRAFDQIHHDCSLQNLHVVFALDRAGLVGADGQTHHGTLDLAYLRPIPNIVVMAPKDEQELRDMLYSALYDYTSGPVAIRFPRGNGIGLEIKPMNSIPLGKAEIVRNGNEVCLIAIGKMVRESMEAADLLEMNGISAEVINARFVKPLDTQMLDYVYKNFSKIITLEDGQVQGGFGSAVAEYLAQQSDFNSDLLIHGIPDRLVEHGTQAELFHDLKMDGEGIAEVVGEFFGREINLKEEVLTGTLK